MCGYQLGFDSDSDNEDLKNRKIMWAINNIMPVNYDCT